MSNVFKTLSLISSVGQQTFSNAIGLTSTTWKEKVFFEYIHEWKRKAKSNQNIRKRLDFITDTEFKDSFSAKRFKCYFESTFVHLG